MKEQNIEKLFRDAFSNFEADVNPSMWANIEQGLPASPQNIPGNSPLAKPAGFFGKISLGVVILATAISAILVGTVIYFSSQKPASKDTLVQAIKAEPQASHATIPAQTAPVAKANVPAKESKVIAEKQVASKAQEKAHLTKPVQQTASPEKKPESVPDNSMQVSAEKTSASEPVNVAAHEHTSAFLEKISTEHAITQNNQPDASGKVYNPSSGETFTATAGPANNAPSTNEVTPVEPEEQFRFFMPNVFTPNGDGLNDNLKPIVNTGVTDYEMTIYDRYGFEIFKSRDIAFPWDGKLKDGELATQAVYVYIIKLTDFKNEEHNYIGYVALLK